MRTSGRVTFRTASRPVAGAILALELTVGFGSAQSLGDVARQEEARRKTVTGAGKVYTNDKLKSEPAPPASSIPATSAPQTAAKPADKDKPASGGQTPPAGSAPADGKKDEAYWRTRIQSARESLGRAKTFAEALQSRINGLSAEFTAKDDPAQRNVVAAERQKALTELDRVKKEIEQYTKALADIQEEARRANVPAGWLR